MLKLTAVVLSLGFVLSLQAANDQIIQNAANVPAANLQDVNASDPIIAQKIKDVLTSSAFSDGFENITVDVQNGIVILTGTVNSNSDKVRIESRIREFPGVRNLDSKLTVDKEIPQGRNDQNDENNQETADADNSNGAAAQISQDLGNTANDQALNAKIRQALIGAKIGSGFDAIILNTNGGIVTLEGVVTNINDQQKLIIEIRKIDGVKAVKNNLQIKKN